jgi:hypothetical protein
VVFRTENENMKRLQDTGRAPDDGHLHVNIFLCLLES